LLKLTRTVWGDTGGFTVGKPRKSEDSVCPACNTQLVDITTQDDREQVFFCYVCDKKIAGERKRLSMISLKLILMLLALIAFALAAIKVPSGPRIDLVATGLFLWLLAVIASPTP